jgi:putative transposase
LGWLWLNAVYRRHGRSSHLFQGHYKAILVDKNRYLLELFRYVVLNPLRAKGMVNRLEDWPWSSYPAMSEDDAKPEWLTTDWILSLFGKQRRIATEKYLQFIREGAQHQPKIWSNLKGKIYLGDAAFVNEMQKRIGREKDDLNIPQQQKRPIAKPLSEIAAQHKDRRTAIIAAYKTGAYSQ